MLASGEPSSRNALMECDREMPHIEGPTRGWSLTEYGHKSKRNRSRA